jgi:hypothetical protein
LAVEGTPNVSGAFEDLTKLFEILVHVLLFNGVVSFLLGRNFFSTDTAEFDKSGAGGAKWVWPIAWTFGVSNTTSDFIEKVGRGNRTNEGGEYVSGKSVESLKMTEGYGKWLRSQ